MAYGDQWEAPASWRRTIAGTLDFRGRSRRTEIVYWWLLWMVLVAIAMLASIALFRDDADLVRHGIDIAMALPSFALFARRLHDQDRPAWLALLLPLAILLSLLREHRFEEAISRRPFDPAAFASGPLEWAAGALLLVVFVLLVLPGTEGPNRYGEDPRL